jgi:uridylate kinase
MPRYSRVVLKSSGGARAGREGWGIDPARLAHLAGEVLSVQELGLEVRSALTARTEADVRVMTAFPLHSMAEPYIRLRAVHHLRRVAVLVLAGAIGQPFVTTDYPAVQRALGLGADALLVAKHGVDGVYDRDPNQGPGAIRLAALTYAGALARQVKVMDTSALVLANEQNLVMYVFDVAAKGAMRAICSGEDTGTRISG